MVKLGGSESAELQLWLDDMLPEGFWLRVVVLDLLPARGPLHESELGGGGADAVRLRTLGPGASMVRASEPGERPPSRGNRLLTSWELAEAGARRIPIDALPDQVLRYGVLFSGGWAAVNLGTILFPDDYVLGKAPLLDCRPLRGGPGRHEERVWLSPAPDGPVQWIAAWPGEGIGETWTAVDWSVGPLEHP